MSRLMSVALTEAAVVAQHKTVTRRLGWWQDKRGRWLVRPGDTLTLCRKVMGRKPGEPLVRLAEVEVIDVDRVQLDSIDRADVEREGFRGWTPGEFVSFFTAEMKCPRDATVTRIEWRYLDVA